MKTKVKAKANQILLLTAWALVPLLSRADEPPPHLKPIFDAGERQRPGLIKYYENTIKQFEFSLPREKADLKKAKAGRPVFDGEETTYTSAEAKQKDVARREALVKQMTEGITTSKEAIALLKSKRLPIIPEMVESLSVGDVGTLSYGAKALQILDDNTARAEVNVQSGVDKPFRLIETRKFEVIVQGIDFTNIADGDTFEFDGIMEVTGTRTYATVIGASKKVLVISPCKQAAEIEEWAEKPHTNR